MVVEGASLPPPAREPTPGWRAQTRSRPTFCCRTSAAASWARVKVTLWTSFPQLAVPPMTGYAACPFPCTEKRGLKPGGKGGGKGLLPGRATWNSAGGASSAFCCHPLLPHNVVRKRSCRLPRLSGGWMSSMRGLLFTCPRSNLRK